MRLNPAHLSQMTQDQMRLLQCMEILSKNHQIIPMDLIGALYKRPVYKELKQLMVWKLITYENNAKACGYRLGYGGYDYMALYTLNKRGLLGIGNQLGVGKESDVYLGKMVLENDSDRLSDGIDVVVKIHRLGRTSFRTVKNNRDYMGDRQHASWLYMSRLSAQKEFEFMSILQNKLPVPIALGHNRHTVVMSQINGYPVTQIKSFNNAQLVYEQMKNIFIKLAEFGLIHGDLNVFNLMVSEQEQVFLIDFPQMVSTSHKDAEFYYKRDMDGIISFGDKFNCDIGDFPSLHSIIVVEALDVQVKASGFIKPKKIKVKKDPIEKEMIKLSIGPVMSYKEQPEKQKTRKQNKNKGSSIVPKADYSSYRQLVD